MTQRARAPAKVNLTLNVTGNRCDQYHNLDSLVLFVELADTLEITPSDRDSFSITPSEQNIITKTLNAYRQETSWSEPLAITLNKNIPIAAGLGGGSSDAAATLNMLNNLCPRPIPSDAMLRIAQKLGADVPLCLQPQQQSHSLWRMQGIGEVLEPVYYPPAAQFGIILINPKISVPTGAVFDALKPQDFQDTLEQDRFEHPLELDEQNFMNWLACGNSLTEPAINLHPEIKDTLKIASSLNTHKGFIASNMSGSGGTVFALFDTTQNAKHAFESATKILPNLSGKASPFWSWCGGVFYPQPSPICDSKSI